MPTQGLSSFPIEVWRQILRLATLDPDDALSIFLSGRPPKPDTLCDLRIYRTPARAERMRDKSAITLVCKAWRAIGIEYLFESVSLVLRPAEHMHRPIPRFLTSPTSPFQYTRHLVVEILKQSKSAAERLEWFRPFLSCLKSLPRLQALRLQGDAGTSMLVARIVASCGPSLRYFETQNIQVPDRTQNMLKGKYPKVKFSWRMDTCNPV